MRCSSMQSGHHSVPRPDQPVSEHAPGQASLNLLRMAKEGLLLPLRRAVRTAGENNHFASEKGTVTNSSGRLEEVSSK